MAAHLSRPSRDHLKWGSIVLVILLICAIVLLTADRALYFAFFQSLCLYSWLDQLTLLALAFLPLLLVIAISFSRGRAATMRMVTNTAVLVLIVVGVIAFQLLYSSRVNAAAVAAIAAVAATIGWLMQRQAALEISKKQHTLNILLQLLQSELFNRHRSRIFSRWPDRMKPSSATVEEAWNERLIQANYHFDEERGIQKLPLIESVLYVCNYYEFLAAAVYHGDIDDALLKTSIGPIMARTYDKFEAFIHNRMTLKGNKPTRSSSYYNFWWLINKHWKMRVYEGGGAASSASPPATGLPPEVQNAPGHHGPSPPSTPPAG